MTTDTGAKFSARQLLEPVQGEFFFCDVLGVIPKDDMASMEHPLFSLSTRPDRRILSYEHRGTHIQITPSVKGLATIHDKDVLIYCISQLVAGLNAGKPVSREVRLTARDLMVATGRETSGDGYRRLREAFERLAGTRIATNMETGGIETTRGFGLIEAWEILRRTRSGRMISVSVTLSDWLYRAVLDRAVLTLSRDYFTLRKPLERRIYEIARKHCGSQPRFQIGLDTLRTKAGSASPRRVFRKMIRDMVAEDHLPDYTLSFTDDLLVVRPRTQAEGVVDGAGQGARVLPPLQAEDYDAARAAAPGLDIYAVEADWRAHWARSGQPRISAPGKAFAAFCAARAARDTS